MPLWSSGPRERCEPPAAPRVTSFGLDGPARTRCTRSVQPLFLVVSEDPAITPGLADDLRRRFGADYRVVSSAEVEEAVDVLRRCAADDHDVALVIADERLAAVEFLAR